LQRAKRGRRTSKQPVLGILCRHDYVWAEIVTGVESTTLLPLINQRAKCSSVIYSDTWRGYADIAASGCVYRLIDCSKSEFSDAKGTRINGLVGFWGYLKRHLVSKGAIRRERIPLYSAEYVWRFNHCQYSRNGQIAKPLKMLYNYKQVYKT
jgi:transposase-like protein